MEVVDDCWMRKSSRETNRGDEEWMDLADD